MDLFPIRLRTFLYMLGFHWYTKWSNLSRNVGVVSGWTHGQTNGWTDRHLNKRLFDQNLFLSFLCFLTMDLFPNGLKTFLLAWGFHQYHSWANRSRNVGLVSGQTQRLTNRWTDRHLKKRLLDQNLFLLFLCFLTMDLFPNGLKAYLLAWGFH